MEEPVKAPPLTADACDAPQAVPAEAGALDAVRLELRVEELERRLSARTLELETELRAKERLRERVRELTRRVDELQDTAAVLHREAVSATSLARELDETLKVAAEARRQLGSALEAERARRADAEGCAETELARVRKQAVEAAAQLESRAQEAAAGSEAAAARLVELEAELAQVRRHSAQQRQKATGHEAHIESLRVEREQALAAQGEARRELEALQAERAQLSERLTALQRTFEADRRADEENLQRRIEGAEQIRREGVEAFEQAREVRQRLELETERLRGELAEGARRLAAREGELQQKAETFKVELRERAEREMAEQRGALDEERARLYADLEVEREARVRLASAPRPLPPTPEAPLEAPQSRRREIERELHSYFGPQQETPSAPAGEPATPQPSQWDEEMRLLLWVFGGALVAAALMGVTALYRG